MRKNYALLAFSLISFVLNAQTVDWVKGTGGPGSDLGRNVEIDSQGNVFVSGSFRDTVSFDPNSNDYIFTATQFGDAYLQKFDSDGNFLWVKIWTSDAASEYPIISLDSNDDIYFSSYFGNEIDLDPGPGEDIRTNAGIGFYDSYIVKLTNDGDYIWGKAFETVSSNQYTHILNIAVDNADGMVVIGEYQSTVDFDLGPDQHLETGAGDDAFILRLDSNGNFEWVKTLGGAWKAIFVTKVVIDSESNIIIGGGYFGIDVDFDPGPGQTLLSSPSVDNDIYILKLDINGDFLWVKTAEGIDSGPNNGIGDDQVLSIDVDSNDDIYVAGGFSHNINFEPGTDDFFLDSGVEPCTDPPCQDFTTSFIAKITANGQMVWAKNFAGENRVLYGQGGIHSFGNLVALTENDELFFTLNPVGTIEIEVGSDIVSYDSENLFLSFLNVEPSTGDVNQAFFMGNDGFTYMGDFKIVNNILYATGGFRGELEFDDDNSLISVTNSTDTYTLKMRSDILSVADFSSTSEFKMFPNPTSDIVSFVNKERDILSLRILDAQGRSLSSLEISKDQVEQINISEYAPGLYFVVADTNEGSHHIQKLIKQ